MVWEDGKAAFIGEHSRSDGSPTARLCDDLLTRQADGFDHSAPAVPGPKKTTSSKSWEQLEFDFSPAVLAAVSDAEAYVASEVAAHNWRAVTFTSFGKEAIKVTEAQGHAQD